MKPNKPKHTLESTIQSIDLGPNGREYFVTLTNGETIGSKFCLSAESACLIAAAPEMLEALEYTIAIFKAMGQRSSKETHLGALEALVAKAKGDVK